MSFPRIIQGGMGVGVSGWQLARAVSVLGCLGVVSSTGLDTLVVRRLQMGDEGGHMRRAFAHYPVPSVARRVLSEYFIEGGKKTEAPFKPIPLFGLPQSRSLTELTILANFAEVYLARENHSGAIGINLMEKIQMPLLPSIFGAMLAGVDYVMVGAGIPRAVPGLLDDLAQGRPTQMKLDAQGASSTDSFLHRFNPQEYSQGNIATLKRPRFFAIISSATLALTLARKAAGHVDGFVVEGPTAGGHNAPPRGQAQKNERGEPVYGERDQPDIDKIRDLGIPFWLAGSYGHLEKVRSAIDLGAQGVQVGTPFAFCEESGISREIKREVVARAIRGELDVLTDPTASPTGFPFKIVQLPGTVSDLELRDSRTRICDLGYLRHGYRKPDGSLGYRCPGEPPDVYVRKGGEAADTAGRVCVCNGLLATIGVAQRRADGWAEPPLLTAGQDLESIVEFLPPGMDHYHAHHVVDRLRSALALPETA